MDELLEQFLIEGPELVQQAGDALLALERRPEDLALVDSAFRAVHTLKGSAGLFDFPPMGLLLHAAEDLLGAIRAGRRAVDRDTVDELVGVIGQTDRWLTAIGSTGALPEDAGAAAARLVATLRARSSDDPAQRASAETVLPEPEAAWIRTLLASRGDEVPVSGDALVAVRYVPDRNCFFNGDDPLEIARRVPGLAALRVALQDEQPNLAEYDPFACNLVVELLSSASPDEVKAAFRFVPDQVQIVAVAVPVTSAEEGQVERSAPEAASRSLRVDASRIDALAEIVGELVVAKNGLAELATQLAAGLDPRAAAGALADRHAAIDRLVGRLHRAVLGVRLVPMTPLLRRFPRLVRETAASLGKEVELSVEGDDVEVDKSVLDGLFEPLTHLLRNAVDHGVEPAEQRRRAGKPARASLRLAAINVAYETIERSLRLL